MSNPFQNNGADPATALDALREFKGANGYRPLNSLGLGEDCTIVRNAAAMLVLIANALEEQPSGPVNPDLVRHAIEGVADALYLRAFAESAA